MRIRGSVLMAGVLAGMGAASADPVDDPTATYRPVMCFTSQPEGTTIATELNKPVVTTTIGGPVLMVENVTMDGKPFSLAYAGIQEAAKKADLELDDGVAMLFEGGAMDHFTLAVAVSEGTAAGWPADAPVKYVNFPGSKVGRILIEGDGNSIPAASKTLGDYMTKNQVAKALGRYMVIEYFDVDDVGKAEVQMNICSQLVD